MDLLEFLQNAGEGDTFKIRTIHGVAGGCRILKNMKTKDECAVPTDDYFQITVKEPAE